MKIRRFLSVLLFAAAIAVAFAYGRFSAQAEALQRFMKNDEDKPPEHNTKHDDTGTPAENGDAALNVQCSSDPPDSVTIERKEDNIAKKTVKEAQNAKISIPPDSSETIITENKETASREKAVKKAKTTKASPPPQDNAQLSSITLENEKQDNLNENAAPNKGNGKYTIMLNTKTYKYHTKSCRTLARSDVKSLFAYKTSVKGGTESDLEYISSLGYTPCKICSKSNNEA